MSVSLTLSSPGLIFVMISQLGFAGGRAEGRYGDAYTSNFAMDDVRCDGDEEHLQDCSYDSVDDCTVGEPATASCYY